MRAARMYGYQQPLVLEDVKVPEPAAEEVLVKVTAAGMCRSDVQLMNGYFRDHLPLTFPATPGHEIAGVVEKIGSLVPKVSGFSESDQVVVAGGWGDGICRSCQAGNTQICGHVRIPAKVNADSEGKANGIPGRRRTDFGA
jgi:alcohol dehydrogenase, propanol-preferring